MAQRRLHSEGAAPAARTRAQSPGHASARRLCSLVCSPMEPMHARPVVTSVILKNTFAGLGLGFVPTVHGGISGLHSFWWPVEPHRKLGEILPGHNGNPFRFHPPREVVSRGTCVRGRGRLRSGLWAPCFPTVTDPPHWTNTLWDKSLRGGGERAPAHPCPPPNSSTRE